jgi:PAS domain S-box-containing protein
MIQKPIFDYIKEQVVITDPDGVVIYANSVAEEITGYKLSEMIGKKPTLWGGQMPKNFYKTMWEKISKEKKSIRVLVTNKRKDGKLYDALLHISPVLDTSGKIQMFVGMETLLSKTD